MEGVASHMSAVAACIDDCQALLRGHRIVPEKRLRPGMSERPPILIVGGTTDRRASLVAAVPAEVAVLDTPARTLGEFGAAALVHAMDGVAAVVFIADVVPLSAPDRDLVLEASKKASRMIFCLADASAADRLRAEMAGWAPRFASAPCLPREALADALMTVAAHAHLFDRVEELRKLRSQIVMSLAGPLDERLRAARRDEAYIARTLEQEAAAKARRSAPATAVVPASPWPVAVAEYFDTPLHRLVDRYAAADRVGLTGLRHDLDGVLADTAAIWSNNLARRLERVAAAALSRRFSADAGRVESWVHARLLAVLAAREMSADGYPVTIRPARPVRRWGRSPMPLGAPGRLDVTGFDIALSADVYESLHRLASADGEPVRDWLGRVLGAVQVAVAAEVESRCDHQDAALARTLGEADAWWAQQVAARLADIGAAKAPDADLLLVQGLADEVAALRAHVRRVDAVLQASRAALVFES